MSKGCRVSPIAACDTGTSTIAIHLYDPSALNRRIENRILVLSSVRFCTTASIYRLVHLSKSLHLLHLDRNTGTPPIRPLPIRHSPFPIRHYTFRAIPSIRLSSYPIVHNDHDPHRQSVYGSQEKRREEKSRERRET